MDSVYGSVHMRMLSCRPDIKMAMTPRCGLLFLLAALFLDPTPVAMAGSWGREERGEPPPDDHQYLWYFDHDAQDSELPQNPQSSYSSPSTAPPDHVPLRPNSDTQTPDSNPDALRIHFRCGVGNIYQSTVPRGQTRVQHFAFLTMIRPGSSVSISECIAKCCALGPNLCQYMWIFQNKCFGISCGYAQRNCEPVSIAETTLASASIYASLVYQIVPMGLPPNTTGTDNTGGDSVIPTPTNNEETVPTTGEKGSRPNPPAFPQPPPTIEEDARPDTPVGSGRSSHVEWNPSSTSSVPVPSQTPAPTGTTSQMAKPIVPTPTSQNAEQTGQTGQTTNDHVSNTITSSIGAQSHAVVQNVADSLRKNGGPNLLTMVAVPVLVVVGCILIVSGIIVGLSAIICEKGKRAWKARQEYRYKRLRHDVENA